MIDRIKNVDSVKKMKKIIKEYFEGFKKKEDCGSDKIAWCTSVGPAELLLSMGFKVYYPENHGAMLGATRMATDVIPVANALGYSPEICSYLTSDIGAYIKGETALLKAFGLDSVPKPDILVYNNNQCREVQDWFAFYAREWDVPIVGIQSPRVIGKIKESHVRDIESQIKGIIPVLEKVSGKKFKIDLLSETLRYSKECTERWKKVLNFAKESPAPFTFFEHCIHMAPAVILRGTIQAVEYYDHLLLEIEDFLERKLAIVPKEKVRLYWDGMPVWGRLRMLGDLFFKLDTSVVASTYCNSWVFESLDFENPFESMARASLELFNVRDEDFKEFYIENWIKSCNIQGLIFHDAKTCPYNSNSRFGLPRRLQNKLGIPSIVINGDLNDLRCFSDEQTRTNIEAFIEQILEG